MDNVSIEKKIEIKTQISNLVYTTHFWKKTNQCLKMKNYQNGHHLRKKKNNKTKLKF